MEHVSKCVQTLDGTKAAQCPHPLPWCPTSFESAQKRRFHLQDVHCIEFPKGTKRCRSEAETEIKAENDTDGTKKPRRSNKPDADMREASPPKMKYEFVNENVRTVKSKATNPTATGAAVRRGRRSVASKRSPTLRGTSPSAANMPAYQPPAIRHWKRSASASSTSSKDTTSVSDWATDETAAGTETPASSVGSDVLQNIDPRLLAAQMEVVSQAIWLESQTGGGSAG